MNIYIDLASIVYFSMTVVCGLFYGYHCYKDGIRKGADDTIEMLYQGRLIDIDEETGEIVPANSKK